MTRALVIRTTGQVEEIDLDLSAEGLKAFVGGPPDALRIPRLEDRFDGTVGAIMVVDGQGKERGKDLNEMATRLYAPAPDRAKHFLVGDVLLVGTTDRGVSMDFTELPEEATVEALEMMFEMFEGH